jgi:hypothetical protein
MSSEHTETISFDLSQLGAAERKKVLSEVQGAAGRLAPVTTPTADEMSIDASKLTGAQREQLTTRLRDIASGLALPGGGILGIEDSHSSHTDTDGWI